MAYIEVITCPYCKSVISSDHSGWNDITKDLGPKERSCPKCSRTYMTRATPWSEKSDYDRFRIYLKIMVGMLYSLFFYCAISMFIFAGIRFLVSGDDPDHNMTYLVLTILGGVGFLIYRLPKWRKALRVLLTDEKQNGA
jgi:hypothetical protein